MVKDDKIELRSEKVRSIIGQIPSRIVRFGTGVISIIILLLFIGGYLFKYPIILNIPVNISSTPEAVLIKVKDNGTIFYIHKNDGQKIKKGDSIAMLSSDTSDLKVKNKIINSPIDGKLLLNYKYSNWLSKNSIIAAIIPIAIESYYIQTLIPYEYFSSIHMGQLVKVELDGYSYSDYGFLEGYIDYISPISINIDDKTYFNININLPKKMLTTSNKLIEFTPYLKGNANIILSEKPLFKSFVNILK